MRFACRLMCSPTGGASQRAVSVPSLNLSLASSLRAKPLVPSVPPRFPLVVHALWVRGRKGHGPLGPGVTVVVSYLLGIAGTELTLELVKG